MKRIWLIFLFPLSLCIAYAHSVEKSRITEPNITRQLRLRPFTAVNVNNFIDVNIIAGKSWNMSVTGSMEALKNLQVNVRNQTLYLYDKGHIRVDISMPQLREITRSGKGNMTIKNLNNQKLIVRSASSGQLTVSGRNIDLQKLINRGTGPVTISGIYSQNTTVTSAGNTSTTLKGRIGLRDLTVNGRGNIYIADVNSPVLVIHASQAGNIQLQGVIHLQRLNYAGSGNVKIYWVDSNALKVDARGEGTVSLAGVARLIDARSYGKAHLDMRYLRSDNAFIKTYDESSTDVWSAANLFALADDDSSIYYYYKPKYMNRIMRQAGSILPMQSIPGALVHFNATFPP